MIRYTCPKCGVEMESPDGRAGKIDACPECGQGLQVPPPKAVSPKWLVIALAALGGAVATGGGIGIGLAIRQPKAPRHAQHPAVPVQPAKESTPLPAATRKDLAAACREAARGLSLGDTAFYQLCLSRLREGLPMAFAHPQHAQRQALLAWRGRLPLWARDEYAQRCIALANQVRADVIAAPGVGPDTSTAAHFYPLELYWFAFNIAHSPDVRANAGIGYQNTMTLIFASQLYKRGAVADQVSMSFTLPIRKEIQHPFRPQTWTKPKHYP